MSPLDHRFIRWLDDHFRGLFTPVGRVVVLGGTLPTLLLLGGLVPPLLLLFSCCVTGLVAAFLLGMPFRPRLKLERHLTAFPSAGEVFRYGVTVSNQGRRVAREVLIEERGLPADLRPVGDPPRVAELAPGQSAHVTLELNCLQRGAYELNALQAASCYPTGLVKWPRRVRARDRLLVYPSFQPLEEFDVPVGRNFQPGGIAVASAVGDSTEFLGTRDYRPGDPLRQIHWPSSARTGRLIAKEFQEEYFVRLALVLDVEVRSAEQEKRFERSLSIAASIADALARHEYIIDLFAAGREVFHFQAGRALAHLENILEILACIDSGDQLDVAALEAAILPQAERISAVILVLMDWDEPRARLVRALKAHGVVVRVIALSPDAKLDELSADERVVLP
jgi:uncharacterized protein (DUF58 family)